MAFKALTTLDLPEATAEQRKAFYAFLENKHWHRITTLRTAWSISFDNSYSREDAIQELKTDIMNAQAQSNVRRIEYAIQLDHCRIIIENQ